VGSPRTASDRRHARPSLNGKHQPEARDPVTDQDELHLVASLVENRDRIPVVRLMVGVKDLSSYPLQRVYAAILDLHDRGAWVDAAAVHGRLREAGDLDDVGTEFLGKLAGLAKDVASPDVYARRVKEHAEGRELRGLFRELATMADRPCGSVAEMAGQAREKIDQLIGRLAGAGVNGSPARNAITRTFDMIETKRVKWVWDYWLPEGMLCLLEGDPGLAKTMIALDIAGRITRGWCMPPAPRIEAPYAVRGGVLILSAEDSAEHVLRPRLEAVEADMKRVQILDGIPVGSETRTPSLLRDLDVIEALIVRDGIKLVIVDPLAGFVDQGLDLNKDQDVRQVMTPLKNMAERTGCTFLFLRHLNKLSGGPAMYRGGGSIAVIAAMRAALLVAKHPTDADRCVLAMNKCNVAAYPRSIVYRPEGSGLSARVEWGDECELNANDLVGRPAGRAEESTSACEDWLRGLLAEGPAAQSDIMDRAKASGYSQRTVYRAKEALKVTSAKEGFTGPWKWQLPAEDMTIPD
jgi:hypothetical protein